jgi:ABC-type amino acid transport substrate-binding protein
MHKSLALILLLLLNLDALGAHKLSGGLLNIAPWGVSKDKGIHTDVIKKISQVSGIELKYELLPLKRILENLKNGLIDYTILIPRQYMHDSVKSLGIIEKTTQFFIHNKSFVHMKLSEFTRIGILLGDEEITKVLIKDHFSKKITVETVSDFPNLFKMVSDKRLQGVVYTKGAFESFKKQIQFRNLATQFSIPMALNHTSVSFIISKKAHDKNMQAVAKIKNAIKTLKTTGQFKVIKMKYL